MHSSAVLRCFSPKASPSRKPCRARISTPPCRRPGSARKSHSAAAPTSRRNGSGAKRAPQIEQARGPAKRIQTMFVVHSYPLAVVFCVLTMFCWGSWATTRKLARPDWRFELFYWDYTLGVLLITLASGSRWQQRRRRPRIFLRSVASLDRLPGVGAAGRRSFQSRQHSAGRRDRDCRHGGGISGGDRTRADHRRDHELPRRSRRQRGAALRRRVARHPRHHSGCRGLSTTGRRVESGAAVPRA